MNTIAKILSFLSLLFFGISVKAQTTYYVSTSGSNTNKGDIAKPFKSIEKALEQAKKIANKDVKIMLRAGTYYLDETLVLKDITTKSLSVEGYKNEQVFISGGRKLSLKWTAYNNGIYKATIPDGIHFERLYVNKKLQVLGRYPNYDANAKFYNGTAADAISPAKIKQWKNPVGAYVHGLHKFEWGGFDYRITSVDKDGNPVLEGGWQNNRPAEMHAEYRFVENVFEELDTANEWFLDKNTLYYFPPKDVDINKALVEVSNLKNSIELRGTEKNPVKNVSFSKLSFIDNERTFWDTKEQLLRSDWAIYRGGAIVFDGTENCKITDCNFTNLGGNAVMVTYYNKHTVVSGCHIYNIGASAICFIGGIDAVRSPQFSFETYIPYNELDKTPGPKSNNYPQNCTASNNLIHDIGRIEKQATGVEIEISKNITVSHNSIYNTPRAGLNIGDGCFGGHIIEYNDVFNTVLETGDHGSFNSWGRDRYWGGPSRNYMDSLVAVHPELILLDAQNQNTIRNNRFRCDHGWDIDLDDGSSNCAIYNNLCLNGGLKLREGFYRTVTNNIMINNSFHPHAWFENSGDVFKHNILMRRYAPARLSYWGKELDYNVFPNKEALANAQSNHTDLNSIVEQIEFVNPAIGDYRLKAGSKALALGFKNFPMNEFGVQKASLKKIALTPKFSEPKYITETYQDLSRLSIYGCELVSVNGLGDRSAYGLPDETGVIVISPGNGAFLKSGFMDRDVIVGLEGKKIKDAVEFQKMYNIAVDKGKYKMEVEIIRNQLPVKLMLDIKL